MTIRFFSLMDAFSDLKVGLVLSPPPAHTQQGFQGVTKTSRQGVTNSGFPSPPQAVFVTPEQPPAAHRAATNQEETTMEMLDLQQAGNMLEAMTITQTIDVGHAIVHIGTDEHGRRVVLVNDCCGQTMVTTSH
jgi:hypothetical protein